MRRVLFFCMLLLCASGSAGYSCVTFRDCPKPECAGSVRVCAENLCQPTQCLVPRESDLSREDVQSFEDAVKPYEAGINLSIKTRNPSAVKNSIIGSLGLQRVLTLFLRAIALFVVALIAALFIIFARGRGLGKLLVIILLIGAAIVAMMIVFGTGIFFPQHRTWSEATVADFVPAQFKKEELGSLQQKYLSEQVLDGIEATLASRDSDIDILVIEADAKEYVRYIRIGRIDQGDIIRIRNEEVLRQTIGVMDRLIFDEDRFVYVVTGPRDEARQVTESTIARYPSAPTPSRLFVSDVVPPTISDITPAFNALTNDRRVHFKVTDNESGVEHIEVKDINGFEPTGCSLTDTARECSFTAQNLREGSNQFEIWAKDRAGNVNRKQSLFIFDDRGADITVSIPEGQPTADNRITITFADPVAGIDPSTISADDLDLSDCNITGMLIMCTYDAPLSEGANELRITAADNAGNVRDLSYTVYFDTLPSLISIKDYSFDIYEDSEILQIMVNDHPYDVSQCSKAGTRYTCTSAAVIRTVSVKDRAGNVAEARN